MILGGMRVAGIDGTKGGWVVIELENGRFAAARVLRPIETRFDKLPDCQVLGIDVPIGFGPRAADAAAREFLRGATSSVFTTSSRDLYEQPYGPGLGLSAQSHALGPRVIHTTRLAETDNRLREVHPEVSFRAMNGAAPLRYRKKSAGGVIERIQLLRVHGIELDALGEAATMPIDGVLDAAAAAWSAMRIGTGHARSLPDPPEIVDGQAVAIWY
jgi:predicted RNase H-like nuclease